jgi:hypothetical protein
MAGRKKRLPEEAGLSGQPAGEKTTKELASAPATSAPENASRTAPKLGKVDATMTDPVLGPALIAKFQAGWYDTQRPPSSFSITR